MHFIHFRRIVKTLHNVITILSIANLFRFLKFFRENNIFKTHSQRYSIEKYGNTEIRKLNHINTIMF